MATTDILRDFLDKVAAKYQREQTSEYGYRTELEELLTSVFSKSVKKLAVDNDPKAVNKNKPDFVIVSGDLPIMYLEAKSIGVNLEKVTHSEQMSRYYGYDNLILTDCLEWWFFCSGIQCGEPIMIATKNQKTRQLSYLANNFRSLLCTLEQFPHQKKETIKSGTHLAKIMGGKAQRIRDNVVRLLETKRSENQELINVFTAIQKLLVSDLNIESFADMYAQTLTYGLFVARYYDSSSENFSRKEARDLIPASNPFLQQFFDHIAGANFPSSLSFIVDELCEAFVRSDVKHLMEQHLNQKIEDPVIHFYEDFLTEYDLDLKKHMGAYYTPMPVVNYMVRSVDAILQKEFRLKDGLADTSTSTNGEHRVQILDPATGTGTFISHIIHVIYEKFIQQKGIWPTYVHRNLLPRLFGFELMMTPYTIAHLRLSLAFKQTGFKYFNKRLGIYLTNTLDNDLQNHNQLIAPIGLVGSLAQEAQFAHQIKNEKPIMVVIGNPPYSGISSNNTTYALDLVNKYKVEPGGHQKLQERKNWLNDDYVKFIAFAEEMVAKNKSGIVAFITNNGFIDNPTFRGMRWHLRQTFNKIYILNLHGNARKHETTPDGGKDENVFDIMQGVSILLAIKTNDNTAPAEIYYSELFGTRQAKFAALNEHQIKFALINPDPKMEFFVPKDTRNQAEYERGIPINELMPVNTSGIVTMGDGFIIDENPDVIKDRISDLKHNRFNKDNLQKFKLGKNYANWILSNISDLQLDEQKIVPIAYRPFDKRYTYFDKKVIWRLREKVMQHMVNFEDNSSLSLSLSLEQRKEYRHDI